MAIFDPVMIKDGGGASPSPFGSTTSSPTVEVYSDPAKDTSEPADTNGQGAVQWLTNVLNNLSKGDLIALYAGNSEGQNSIWSKIMSEGLNSGALTLDDVEYLTTYTGYGYTPEFEKSLNTKRSQEATIQDQQYQTQSRDTSLLSSYQQLQKLGLNGASVVDVGGAKAGVSSSAANTDKSMSSSERKLQDSKLRFDRNTQMAKTILGLVGGMSSAGIYGGSMAAAKTAVAGLTTAASKEAARIRASGMISSAMVKRQKGRSRYDGNGNFQYHETYDW